MSMVSSMKRPAAWLPVAMSVSALMVVLVHIAVWGTAREPDEGTAAHLWQLLMATQTPIVVFHGVTAWPRGWRRAFSVLALQVGAALAALAPVYLLGL